MRGICLGSIFFALIAPVRPPGVLIAQQLLIDCARDQRMIIRTRSYPMHCRVFKDRVFGRKKFILSLFMSKCYTVQQQVISEALALTLLSACFWCAPCVFHLLVVCSYSIIDTWSQATSFRDNRLVPDPPEVGCGGRGGWSGSLLLANCVHDFTCCERHQEAEKAG